MVLQPFDDALMITGHGRRRRVVHVFEDGLEHRAGPLDEPLDMRVAVAVDVRQEEKLPISHEHETREMHGSEVVLCRRELGHQCRQLFGERLGVGRTLDREVKDEMTLTHRASPWCRIVRIRESIFEHEPQRYIAQSGRQGRGLTARRCRGERGPLWRQRLCRSGYTADGETVDDRSPPSARSHRANLDSSRSGDAAGSATVVGWHCDSAGIGRRSCTASTQHARTPRSSRSTRRN